MHVWREVRGRSSQGQTLHNFELWLNFRFVKSSSRSRWRIWSLMRTMATLPKANHLRPGPTRPSQTMASTIPRAPSSRPGEKRMMLSLVDFSMLFSPLTANIYFAAMNQLYLGHAAGRGHGSRQLVARTDPFHTNPWPRPGVAGCICGLRQIMLLGTLHGYGYRERLPKS